MILTGKALQYFKNWYWNEWFEEKERQHYIFQNIALEHLETTDKIFLNAILIEFFDSIKCAGFKSLWSYSFGNYDVFKDNWNEHIEQAIIKANEIFNERKI